MSAEENGDVVAIKEEKSKNGGVATENGARMSRNKMLMRITFV